MITFRTWAAVALCFWQATVTLAASSNASFIAGAQAYHAGDYRRAAAAFADAAAIRPATGTLQNLGNAEWQSGRTGPAILAWEQALWMDPFNAAARGNLRLARKLAQLPSPELAWYEVVSSWLPANCWAWITGASLWVAIAVAMLPGILRLSKSAWHQAIAAFGLALFLLSVPAQVGIHSRSRMGFVLQKDAPLRLTPTDEAQYITRLPAGEPARLERVRGRYLLVRTTSGGLRGWIEQSQFGLTCSQPRSPDAPVRRASPLARSAYAPPASSESLHKRNSRNVMSALLKSPLYNSCFSAALA